ncbi:RdgB/HAM1 family non-canonical purine NTP pyrophosphatase [Kaistella antarctica]|uniref:dITP/XTP pyrophosphatase n=1 Tax=Kaistella antarctica TaxID=266748 RepID=A0A3S4WPY7_9FLAO|nr:RdgB/HAM1 family non-canonical purine NTP pyrophosphatase [Kaistella antarctica]KEY19638.1 deoxyribonucleotide triphosphate pyrophosphatase [Kaistella antarctica]SEW09328.1 XTP/dITP diphosphohydrolase [Kaistella antarctica]VEH96903.1 Non-canonical purine NTP pyrophosphatase [Kaistella antarctica]
MKKEILIATHNAHKKEEIQQILGDQFTVTSLTDYNIHEEIVEDGTTFHANALIKAQYCFNTTGKPSLGDDSGLVVEAIDERPGIYSARYAGDHDFAKNMAKVLEELDGVENRKAYFVTVMCLVDETGTNYFEGRVYGTLTKEVRGEKGFGYDPIFVPENHEFTFAEMKAEDKNKISHRKKAIEQFLEFVERNS